MNKRHQKIPGIYEKELESLKKKNTVVKIRISRWAIARYCQIKRFMCTAVLCCSMKMVNLIYQVQEVERNYTNR